MKRETGRQRERRTRKDIMKDSADTKQERRKANRLFCMFSSLTFLSCSYSRAVCLLFSSTLSTMLQLYCILLCIGAVAGEDTLRAAAAARGIYMGTAINHGVLTAGGSDAEQYRQVFAKEYNLATAENR